MVYPLSPFLVSDAMLDTFLIEQAIREGRAQLNDPEARVGTTSCVDVTERDALRYARATEVCCYEVKIQFPDVPLTDDLKAKVSLTVACGPIEL